MSPLLVALGCALACGASALAMSPWLARLPEPEPLPAEAAEGVSGTIFASAREKEPYADLAARVWLRPGLVLASAAVGALFGATLGGTGALVFLVPLVPVGALLLVVDWRTTLLPTRLIHPTYAALAVLVPLAALLDRDLDALWRAGLGWLVVGGWFWVCWRLLGAWGFGDVRLARVLGPALGYLGWSEVVVGLLLMLVLGAVGGVLLTLRHRELRRRFPYGPFMLIGAAIAVPWAGDLARALGYAPL